MEKGLRKLNELGLGTVRRVVDFFVGWVGSSGAGVRNEAMGRGESGKGGRTAAKPGPLSRFLVPLAAAAVAGATGLRLPPPAGDGGGRDEPSGTGVPPPVEGGAARGPTGSAKGANESCKEAAETAREGESKKRRGKAGDILLAEDLQGEAPADLPGFNTTAEEVDEFKKRKKGSEATQVRYFMKFRAALGEAGHKNKALFTC